MPNDAFNPVFSDKSRTAHNRVLLAHELTLRRHTAAELIGVLTFNLQHTADGDSFLDSPIAIDTFDERRLIDMRLVRPRKPSLESENTPPHPELTDLGRFVTSKAVLVQTDETDGTLPVANIAKLLAELR